MSVDFSGAAWYRKTATVEATRLDEAREWTTGRGSRLTGAAGDWLVTDGESEWTVAGPIFAETYEQLPSGRWVKTALIQAVQVEVETVVATLEGDAIAEPGDWIARNPYGDMWPITAKAFEQTYAEAAE